MKFYNIEKISNENSFLGISVCSNDSKPINVYAIYRKHNQNIHDFLTHLEKVLDKSKQNTFKLGDFNFHTSINTSSSLKFSNTLETYNFSILNKSFPTRVTDTSSTIIDHVISNRQNISTTISNIDDPLSDNNMLIVDFKNNLNKWFNNRTKPRSIKPTINNMVVKSYLAANKFTID